MGNSRAGQQFCAEAICGGDIVGGACEIGDQRITYLEIIGSGHWVFCLDDKKIK